MIAGTEATRPPRRCLLRRKTSETEVLVLLDLDPARGASTRRIEVKTGQGFLDHLATCLAFHAGWGLVLRCAGDIEVDEHHSVEDSALLLGTALGRALSGGPETERFGSAYAPLDEALARAVVDLSGRAFAAVNLGLEGRRIGELEGENIAHFISSFALGASATLHVDVLRGENAHHRAEAAFKALALSLAAACRIRVGEVPGGRSSKGRVTLEELDAANFEEEA
jgi:imidazoleglycerol-phosphate dehydratase